MIHVWSHTQWRSWDWKKVFSNMLNKCSAKWKPHETCLFKVRFKWTLLPSCNKLFNWFPWTECDVSLCWYEKKQKNLNNAKEKNNINHRSTSIMMSSLSVHSLNMALYFYYDENVLRNQEVIYLINLASQEISLMR